jgi:uncharacterized membrane protein
LLFAGGAVLWLWLFSRVIKYVLTHFRKNTMATLIWSMIGSLPILRPRKILSPWWIEVPTMRYSLETSAHLWIVLLICLVWTFWAYKVFNIFDQVN